MPDAFIGRQLGKYQIQQEIGRGGMARVYRAHDTVLQRPVALKVLAPSLSADPEFARRFEREAITAANLRHPAIVTIFDVGEADGLRYIAMEYIAGRTLNEVLQEHGKLGLPLTIAIITPVAEALDFAHSHGMIHRDVKPHNIMLDTDGRVLLTDFGIAIDPSEGTERLTRTGMFMGTPEYISPEQAQAQPLGGRSDLYSLGIVTYEMLAGRVPFDGGTAQQIMAHVYHAPPLLTDFDRNSQPELDQIFARVLAKDPQARFERAINLVEALRYVARRYGMPTAPREDVAALAIPLGSSAGQATVALRAPNTSPTPATPAAGQPRSTPPAAFPIGEVFGNIRPGQPRAAAPPPDATTSMPANAAPPPNATAATGRRAGTGSSRAPAASGTGGGGRGYAYPGNDDQFAPPPRIPRRRYNEDSGSSIPWTFLALGAVAIAALLLVFVLSRNTDTEANTPPAPTRNPFASQPTATEAPTITLRPATPTPLFGGAIPPTVPGITPTTEALPTPSSTTIATVAPSALPTVAPSGTATIEPSTTATTEPSATATIEPSTTATTEPSATATIEPTITNTPAPSGAPTPVGGAPNFAYFADGTLTVRNDTGSNGFDFNFEPVAPIAISPDGTRVVLDALDARSNTRQIVALDRQSGQLTQLTDGNGDNYQPNWSPNGDQIVFTSTRNGDADIYVMDADGDNQQPLVEGTGDDSYPSFSPDGTTIIFETTRDGPASAIYTASADGQTLTRISMIDQTSSDRSPRWSPDGTEIVFISDRDRPDGSFEAYTQRLDGTQVQRLTDFRIGSVDGPVWSPDGTLIALFGNSSGNNDIYVLDRANDQFIQTINTDADERWPVWSR